MLTKNKSLSNIHSLNDFEKTARKKLPRPIFSYIYHGSEEEFSVSENRKAFNKYSFVPKGLINVSNVSIKTELFGKTYDAPFGIAPMGISALSTYRGDIALARAASDKKIPMIMSGSSLIRLEEVADIEGADWFQAYLPGNTEEIEGLIKRVQNAGFSQLVITIDHPVSPSKENYKRNGFSSPLRPSLRLALDGIIRPRWLMGTFAKTLRHHGMPHFENHYVKRGVPVFSSSVNRDFSGRSHLSWDHLLRIRELWPGRLIIKGILHPEDALRAEKAGADGIIISNHGGRQIDGAVTPLKVLPEIINQVENIPVMIDSGFRRGSDVLKALALGAKFVFVGRPFNYAAACGGEQGVAHAINLLAEEIKRDMALLGVTDINDMSMEQLFVNT